MTQKTVWLVDEGADVCDRAAVDSPSPLLSSADAAFNGSALPPSPQLVVDGEALAVAKEATVAAADYCPFVGPLLEAIAMRAEGEATFLTCWGGATVALPSPDPQKHAAYVDYIRRSLRATCPWLLALLESAAARVVVSPGVFCFMVDHRAGVAFDVPQLVPITRLTPWVDSGERMH